MLVNAYGAYAGDKLLEPLQITRRAPGAHDSDGNRSAQSTVSWTRS